MSDSKEPISVLVTKEDGVEMMRLVDEYNAENKTIMASVSIAPRTTRDNDLSESNKANGVKVKWPMVVTDQENIQVFASQGWGVGAGKDEKGTWQIMLLQHTHGS